MSMASIKDVARLAGVGAGTVSRTLNGSGYVSPETRKKVEKAVRELNYTPNELARQLFRNRSGIIGVMVPDLDHPFFAAFVREVEIALYKLGYKTMVCNTIGISNRERDYLDMLSRNMVDGIITAAYTLDAEDYLKHDEPIISLDRDFGPKIPIIGSDHEQGGKLAAETLLKNGCRRVLDIAVRTKDIVANRRHVVFEETLRTHGIEVINFNDPEGSNKLDHETFWKIASSEFEKEQGIDGIFGTDEILADFLHLAIEAGRSIPEELKLVSYDGTIITRITNPPLTSIVQDIPMLAQTCASTVIDLVEQRRMVPHKQLISVSVRQGGTTYPV